MGMKILCKASKSLTEGTGSAVLSSCFVVFIGVLPHVILVEFTDVPQDGVAPKLLSLPFTGSLLDGADGTTMLDVGATCQVLVALLLISVIKSSVIWSKVVSSIPGRYVVSNSGKFIFFNISLQNTWQLLVRRS